MRTIKIAEDQYQQLKNIVTMWSGKDCYLNFENDVITITNKEWDEENVPKVMKCVELVISKEPLKPVHKSNK